MAWFKRDTRHAAPPEEIAQSLWQILVKETADKFDPGKFLLPQSIALQLRSKARIYLEAAVLHALLQQTEKEPSYESVLRAYEQLIFPAQPDYDGMKTLQACKSAMQDLVVLVRPEGSKPLSWSMAWLSGIGHEETNPATLTLFANYWLSFLATVIESVNGLRPVT